MQGDGSKVPDRGLMGGGSTAQTGEVELVGGRGTAVTGGGAAVHMQGDGSKVTDEGLMGGGSTA
jgi:hypothetical protein